MAGSLYHGASGAQAILCRCRNARQGVECERALSEPEEDMRVLSRYLMVVALGSLMAACSSARHTPQPIVDRSDHTVLAGETVAEDIRTCRTEVHKAAPVSIQPRWLPPLGIAANGAVIGTVDVPHPVWPSREAYRQAVEFCLTARGYEVHGWQ